MSRTYPFQNNFNAGEWSQLLEGRLDLAKYDNAMIDCQNVIPLVQGGVIRRPGWQYTVDAKVNSNNIRLIPFVFSQTPSQSYLLEIGIQSSPATAYIRVHRADQHETSFPGSFGVEITTLADGSTNLPWTNAEIPKLDYVQINDVMYFVNGTDKMLKLKRTGTTHPGTWTIDTVIAVNVSYVVDEDMRYKFYNVVSYWKGAWTGRKLFNNHFDVDKSGVVLHSPAGSRSYSE